MQVPYRTNTPGRVFVLLLLTAVAGFQEADATKAQAADWPHWLGPARNGLSPESSRWDQKAWPPKQPCWEANVDEGSSSPIVVAGRLYTLGWADERDTLYCLDATTGRELWKVSYPAPRYGRNSFGDKGLYGAVTATPEYDPATKYLYTLSLDGDLHCWDTTKQGEKVWSLNLYDRYGMQRRAKIGRSTQTDYGYIAAPLVYDNWLLVEAGGSEGTVVALDKRTGRQLWTSQYNDQAGHTGGMVPMQVEDVPCVAVLTLRHLVVLRLDSGNEGKTVAQYEWATEFSNNVVTPAVAGNEVVITSGYNHKAMCKLRITLDGATKVWEKPVYSKVCTPIIYRGNIYWAWRKPYCVDLETGETRWVGDAFFGEPGSGIITADGRWILWGKRGDLALAETADRSPDEYRELARLDDLFRTDAWPHVVLANGRLYCKDRDGNLKCFELVAADE